MTTSWENFENALKNNKSSFEKIKDADNIEDLIAACGITNAIEVAEIETEFKRRQRENQKTMESLDSTKIMEELVKSKDPFLQINPHVIDRAIKRFPQRVFLAVSANDPKIAHDIYEETSQLPQTETEQTLEMKGYQLSDSPFSNNENLLLCFKETVPKILKVLKKQEEERLKKLEERCNLTHKFIVQFEMVSSRRSCLLIMPLFPATLKQIGDALMHLHNQGVAHMDIKPSNICIDSNGDFILIDLGSAVFFGERSESTRAYIVDGLDASKASKQVDWWMLAATIAERGCGHDGWGSQAKNLSQSQLFDFLETKLHATVWEALKSKLTQE